MRRWCPGSSRFYPVRPSLPWFEGQSITLSVNAATMASSFGTEPPLTVFKPTLTLGELICLAQGHKTVPPVGIESGTSRFRVYKPTSILFINVMQTLRFLGSVTFRLYSRNNLPKSTYLLKFFFMHFMPLVD